MRGDLLPGNKISAKCAREPENGERIQTYEVEEWDVFTLTMPHPISDHPPPPLPSLSTRRCAIPNKRHPPPVGEQPAIRDVRRAPPENRKVDVGEGMNVGGGRWWGDPGSGSYFAKLLGISGLVFAEPPSGDKPPANRHFYLSSCGGSFKFR